jgi:RIO kinase 1
MNHAGAAHIIDVSQSVDLDHPRCLDFLREDLLHLGQFFAKNDVAVPTVREMFDFVTDPAVTPENIEECLEALNASAVARGMRRGRGDGGEGAAEVGAGGAVGVSVGNVHKDGHRGGGGSHEAGPGGTLENTDMVDQVFQQAFIPKRLDEVDSFERDLRRLKAGGGDSEGVYYQSITGMKSDLSGIETTPKILRVAQEQAKVKCNALMATTTATSAQRREKSEKKTPPTDPDPNAADAADDANADTDTDASVSIDAASKKAAKGTGEGAGEDVSEDDDDDEGGSEDGSEDDSGSESEEEFDENGDPIKRRRRKAPLDKDAVKVSTSHPEPQTPGP